MIAKIEHNIRGMVQSVHTRRFRLEKEGLICKEVPMWSRIVIYDRRNNEIEISKYDSQGSLQCRNVYKYDIESRETERVDYNADGTFFSRTITSYNDQGRLIQQVSYKTDGSFSDQRIATFDALGRRFVKVYLHGENLSDQTAQPKADEKLGDFFPSKGNNHTGYRTTEVYDVDDKPLEVVAYDEEGIPKCKVVFTYDAEGRKNREVKYALRESSNSEFEDTPALQTAYVYDTCGRIREVAHYNNELLQVKTVYSYDMTGSKIEEVRQEGNGLIRYIETYDREFDSHGNWTAETKSKQYPQKRNQTLIVVTRRNIIYY